MEEKDRLLAQEERIKQEDSALREHYKETMERKRCPNDYVLMFTEGGESSAVGYAIAKAQDAKSYPLGYKDGYKQGVADQHKAAQMDDAKTEEIVRAEIIDIMVGKLSGVVSQNFEVKPNGNIMVDGGAVQQLLKDLIKERQSLKAGKGVK